MRIIKHTRLQTSKCFVRFVGVNFADLNWLLTTIMLGYFLTDLPNFSKRIRQGEACEKQIFFCL